MTVLSIQPLILLKEFCENNSKKKLFILEKNSGPGIAKNKSIQYVKGKFIAFLDSDAEWLPNKLSEQIEFMKKYSEQSVLPVMI